MVRHSNGRVASLLDSAGPGTSRPVDSATVSPAGADEADDALVLRVPLCEGPIELRVPRAAVKARTDVVRDSTLTQRPD
jgi:hypothetical protein